MKVVVQLEIFSVIVTNDNCRTAAGTTAVLHAVVINDSYKVFPRIYYLHMKEKQKTEQSQ